MRHKVCTVEYICNGMESAYLSTDTFGVQICICTERVCTVRTSRQCCNFKPNVGSLNEIHLTYCSSIFYINISK